MTRLKRAAQYFFCIGGLLAVIAGAAWVAATIDHATGGLYASGALIITFLGIGAWWMARDEP